MIQFLNLSESVLISIRFLFCFTLHSESDNPVPDSLYHKDSAWNSNSDFICDCIRFCLIQILILFWIPILIPNIKYFSILNVIWIHFLIHFVVWISDSDSYINSNSCFVWNSNLVSKSDSFADSVLLFDYVSDLDSYFNFFRCYSASDSFFFRLDFLKMWLHYVTNQILFVEMCLLT